MKKWKDIKGQDNAIRCLSGSLRTGRISQSYLFFGPEGVGRSLTACKYIFELFKRRETIDEERLWRSIANKSHPDLIWIKPEEMKAIKIGKDDSDEGTIRWLIGRLNLRPYQAPFSVAVIEDAHLMTLGAANSLLKILEEPPKDAIIILITDRKDMLLETVLSRTTQIRFKSLSQEDTSGIIKHLIRDATEEELELFARFSQGSPGTALRLSEEDVFARHQEVIRTLESAMDAADPALEAWKDVDKNTLSKDLDFLIMLLRDCAISEETGSEQLSVSDLSSPVADHLKSLTASQRHKRLCDLVEAKNSIDANCNIKLLAQVLPSIVLGKELSSYE